MKRLRVSVSYTDETIHPMHAFVRDSPAVDREFVLNGQVTDGVETVLSYVVGDAEAYTAALEANDAVLEYEVTPAEDGAGFFVYARQELDETGAVLAEAFTRETVVLVPPIAFHGDGTMRLSLLGSAADLRATLEALPDGVDVEVLEVGTRADAGGFERALTGRQREAVRVARRLGYYEVPREVGIEEVAEELGCAVSTASELVRRAEAGLVAMAFGGEL